MEYIYNISKEDISFYEFNIDEEFELDKYLQQKYEPGISEYLTEFYMIQMMKERKNERKDINEKLRYLHFLNNSIIKYRVLIKFVGGLKSVNYKYEDYEDYVDYVDYFGYFKYKKFLKKHGIEDMNRYSAKHNLSARYVEYLKECSRKRGYKKNSKHYYIRRKTYKEDKHYEEYKKIKTEKKEVEMLLHNILYYGLYFDDYYFFYREEYKELTVLKDLFRKMNVTEYSPTYKILGILSSKKEKDLFLNNYLKKNLEKKIKQFNELIEYIK